MNSTLWQMFAMLACGVAWRYWRPGGLSAEQSRTVLTTLVYYLLLPALVLDVLWRADVGAHSLQYTLFGTACLAFALGAMGLCGRLFRFKSPQMGAMLLAASFPNVTYLGLPVLEQTFGHWARSVAIQIDMFAFSPAVFTVGIALAQRYGESDGNARQPVCSFLTTPPFLATVLALILNFGNVPAPDWLAALLQKLAGGVVPLMVISLGMALSWRALTLRNLPYAAPVILIKMALMPWFAAWASHYLTLEQAYRQALVLEMAMPCMVLGIVFCDRYRLDSALYAMSVTVTTLLSLLSLPYWHRFMLG